MVHDQDGASVFGSPSLSLSMLCVFVLFMSTVVQNAVSILVYNRQTLLDFRFSAKDLVRSDLGGYKTLPPFRSGIPACLCCPETIHLRRRPKRYRRRGKRSGQLVRLKACSVRFTTSWTKYRAVPRLLIFWRLLDPVDA